MENLGNLADSASAGKETRRPAGDPEPLPPFFHAFYGHLKWFLGFSGGLGAGMVDPEQWLDMKQYRNRVQAVESLYNPDALRQFAEQTPGCFVLPMADIQDLRLQSPSAWGTLWSGGKTVAELRIVRPAREEIALQFQHYMDVSRAVELLSPRYGNAVKTKVW
jgi:hypothetical protein